VALSKTTVLHAESGTGKSSLIQAGLIPLFKENKPEYFPVTFRFDRKKKIVNEDLKESVADTSLLHDVIEKIKEALPTLNAHSLPYIADTEESLWLLAKKFAKASGQNRLLLIFDQFEELQRFSADEVLDFKKAIAELLSPNIPNHIHKEIQNQTSAIFSGADLSKEQREEFNENSRFFNDALEVKLLFVVREDKLGTMSLLSDYFPDILKNDFVLKPLSVENARLAITEPSQAIGDFWSPIFNVEKDAVETILSELKDTATELVDPMQVQIVCSRIEKKVVLNMKDDEVVSVSKTQVLQGDIPPIGDIINDFYLDTWEDVKEKIADEKIALSGEEFNQKRKAIVSLLVVSGSRNMVLSALLVTEKNKNLDEIIVNTLLASGLIREIPSGTEKFYQLCHDRFMLPINKDILDLEAMEKAELDRQRIQDAADLDLKLAIEKAEKEREAAEEQARIKQHEFETKLAAEASKRKYMLIVYIMIISTLLIVIFGGIILRNSKKNEMDAKQERILTILKTIRKGNPTLSLVMAEQAKKKYNIDNKLDLFISEFDSLSYAYMLRSYPLSTELITANVSSNNQKIEVLETGGVLKWDIKSGLLEPPYKLPDAVFLKEFVFSGKKNYLVLHGDSIEVLDEKFNVKKHFPGMDDSKNIVISKDGNFILLGQWVYNYKTGKKIGTLPQTVINDHDQMTSVFLNDSKHVAVGYWSGYVIIFRVDETKKDKIRITGIYPPTKGHTNSVITSIAIDSKDKYLVTGNRESEIGIWKINNLDSMDRVCDRLDEKEYLKPVADKMDLTKPYKILSGHSDNINSVAISPGDSLILSGSKDNSAILWELKTGKKLAIMKGREAAVVYTAFARDGQQMITATEDGIVFLWSRGGASALYKQNKLASFSPFAYYNVGLGKDESFLGLFGDTTDITGLYNTTLSYITDMPVKNLYPGDKEYLSNLKQSLKQIDAMYQSLTNKKEFKTKTTNSQKLILYKFYGSLILRTPELLSKIENTQAKYTRFAKHHQQNNMMLLLDTTDTKTILSNAADLNFIAQYYRDSTTNYGQSVGYLKNAIFTMDAFGKKYPQNKDVSQERILDYGDLALSYLYAKKADSAMTVITKLRTIKDGDGVADMQMIQALLLQNKYDAAIELFENKKYNIVTTASAMTLKERLIQQLDKLKTKNISSPAMDKFIIYVKQ
jgi:WD40 repeat protein